MVTLSREQLEERLAVLHRASLELVQDISLESLLERIARIARQQVRARYAAVGVLGEDGKLEHFIPVGMTEEELALMGHPPVGLGLIGALMHGSETIRLDDLSMDPRSAGFPPHHPLMTTFLGVPIRLGERQLGQVYLTEKEDGEEFTADDEQVIETLAAYAAVAISNARLYSKLIERDRDLTRRNEYQALLNELASTLAFSADIEEVVDKSLNQLMAALGLEAGEIYLRQGDSTIFQRVKQCCTDVSGLWEMAQFSLGEGMVGRVAKTGQASLMKLPGNDGHDLAHFVFDHAIHQIACFPLLGRRGVLGVLAVGANDQKPFGELEMQFLSAIASWIGTAVENLQLSQQQRRLAVLEERERIGMDLHDGVIQSIYAVGLTLEHARLLMKEDTQAANQRIDQAITDLNSTIRDIRSYILDLRPRQLRDEDLMQGIVRLVSEFRANTLTEISLQGPTGGFPGLQAAQAIALFHICQEALANVAKHARARHVDVILWSTPERVLMEVSDDGRGFDADKVKMTLGHGLSNMQTRAHNVGGDVDTSTEPGSGTTILAWVPIIKESS